MDRSTFWQLVEATRTPHDAYCEQQTEQMIARLSEMAREEIIAFWDTYCSLFHDAYRSDLFAAARIINASDSYDLFMNFRDWLIAQGRGVYENALNAPDSLALVELGPGIDADCEQFGYAALYAYERKTGNEMPTRERIRKAGLELWTDEDMKARLPRLWARYVTEELVSDTGEDGSEE
jgi:hypothetical protein